MRTYLPAQWSNWVQGVFYGEDGWPLRSAQARLENLLSHTPTWIVVPEPLLANDLHEEFGGLSAAWMNLLAKPGTRAALIYEVTSK